jgi:NADH-quinone oxidoreductase subunit F
VLSDAAKNEIRRLMAQYPQARSALVPALYVLQREQGWLPPEGMAEVARLMDLDPAEVEAVATFYNMLYKKPQGEYVIELCTNVPCMLRGAGVIAEHLKRRLGVDWGETTSDGRFTLKHMECLGSCGTGPTMFVRRRGVGGRYYEQLTPERCDAILAELRANRADLPLEPDPRGPAHFGGMEPLVLLARVRRPDSHKIETYLADGGYQALEKALKTMTPQQVLEEVKNSGLRGRGGAGFPAGMKWGFLPKGVYPRYLVCNADESEPGTFKDRMLMEYDPHQVLEGIILASYACEVSHAFIYIRGEYTFAHARLKQAIEDAYAKGFLGRNILGTGYSLELTLHQGAGAYICGEETALLTSLEGQRGHPRLKPPFPAVEGLYRKPTVINNVETLCNVPHIIRHGAAWYRSFGTEKSPGFRIFCLSGHVQRPGLYELPHGVPLRTLIYEYGGGPPDGQPVKAVVPGGLSMKLLSADQLDTPLDFEAVAAAGSLLGSAGVIVFGQNQSMVEVALRTIAFYREESCGKCTPCREGTTWLEKILKRVAAGGGTLDDLDLMMRITQGIAGGRSFCPFGDAAVWGLQSNLTKFRDEFVAYIRRTNPDGKEPEVPVWANYRPHPAREQG